MKADVSVILLGFYRVFLVKSGWTVAKGNVYLRAYRKDLELFLASSCLAWSNGCDIMERFELSLTAEVKLKLRRDYRPKRRVISFAFGLVADVVTP